MRTLYIWKTPECLGAMIALFQSDADPLTIELVPIGKKRGILEKTTGLYGAHLPVLTHASHPNKIGLGPILMHLKALQDHGSLKEDLEKEACFFETFFWMQSQLIPMIHECLYYRAGSKLRHPQSTFRLTQNCFLSFSRMNQALKNPGLQQDIFDDPLIVASLFPWLRLHQRLGISLDTLTHLKKWYDKSHHNLGVTKALEKLRSFALV